MPMSDPDWPVSVTYRVPRWLPQWAVPEVPVPEATWHDQAIEYLRSVLLAWAARAERNVLVARNLGIRWVESEPRCGFDPDLCVIEPPPAEVDPSTLRLWEADHFPPWLAIEIVSPGHPYKDYVDTPDRCAASGVNELWVYDPVLAGPKRVGGPFALQIWTREGDAMVQRHASNAPGYSPILGAWLHPGVHPLAQNKLQTGRTLSPVLDTSPAASVSSPNKAKAMLRISNAEVGGNFWPTLEQVAQQRAEASERELAELRRQLAALRGGDTEE